MFVFCVCVEDWLEKFPHLEVKSQLTSENVEEQAKRAFAPPPPYSLLFGQKFIIFKETGVSGTG